MDAQGKYLALFGMLFCFSLATVKAVDCPNGWVDGSSVEMGCLGYYSNYFINWTEAQDYCNNLPHDSHLVEIKNQDQQDFLVSLLLSG